MFWNCHSVRNKMFELFKFIDDHKIDIALLSETNLNEFSKFYMNSHKCYRLDRNHGGVAILIR